jgi:hypothetical protein
MVTEIEMGRGTEKIGFWARFGRRAKARSKK